MPAAREPPATVPLELKADCARCFGLCCVALPFNRSSDFGVDKDAGTPCRNLGEDLSCTIHGRLRDSGFAGCAVYDCFGAGQKVSQITFHGKDWRGDPATAREMFLVFPVVRQLHELLWYLNEALRLTAADVIHGDLSRSAAKVERLTLAGPEALARLEIAALRNQANSLLLRASDLARAVVDGPRRDLRGADLVGARLAGADLRGASLRGARLLAADLRHADLRGADLTGTDLRAADLSGADLTAAIFLMQHQVDAARQRRYDAVGPARPSDTLVTSQPPPPRMTRPAAIEV